MPRLPAIARRAAIAPFIAMDVMREAGVAITPGLDFDPVEGHRLACLSYAGSEATIVEGARRLKTCLKTWLGWAVPP